MGTKITWNKWGKYVLLFFLLSNSVQDGVAVIDVTALLLNLPFPLVLLVAHTIQYSTVADSQRLRMDVVFLLFKTWWIIISWELTSLEMKNPIYLLISLFLILSCRLLVEKRVQADKEQHVDDQEGNDPNDNNHDNLASTKQEHKHFHSQKHF